MPSSMLSFHVCLVSAYLLLAATLALPTDHALASSQSEIAKRDASTFSDGVEVVVLPNVPDNDHNNNGDATHKQSKLNGRALPFQPPTQPSISLNALTDINTSAHNLTQYVPPICWPGIPGPRARTAITEPRDCQKAVVQVLDGGAMIPVPWDNWHTWTHGSCSIRLILAVRASRDSFPRYDIARAAWRIQTSCINEAHGFRGGIVAVGKGRVFDVSVEASRSRPFQPNDDGGISES